MKNNDDDLKLEKPSSEQLDLLKDFLFFGSPHKPKEITKGTFLTAFPGIASIFMIKKDDMYGGINKYYSSINWTYDVWNRNPNALMKPAKFVKIENNAKDWIKTNGVSTGFISRIKLTDKIKSKLRLVHDSDIRYEVVYDGSEPIKIDKFFEKTIKWNCSFSEFVVKHFGEAFFITKYDPPYSIEILKEKYPKLLKDPVHVWRAKNGIELIHKEPTYDEQKRIFYNWQAMSNKDKEKSDKKCKEFFHTTNREFHNYIMENYWHEENYNDLSKFRLMYNLRDMERNGLKYIHLSKSNKSLTLKPRIPKNTIPNIENNTIPRICVSNSIFGALSAIPNDVGDIYYVHLIEPVKILDNPEVLQYVPDAAMTGECWVLDDEVKTTVVGKLEIVNDLHMVYKFANNNKTTYYSYCKNYNFIPFESLTKRTARRILLK